MKQLTIQWQALEMVFEDEANEFGDITERAKVLDLKSLSLIHI